MPRCGRGWEDGGGQAAEARAAAPGAPLVVTGGNAARLLRCTSLQVEHRPDLLHEGLRALAQAAS